jgi:pimeloyl-ACP methyl ester carboxylesterase
LNRNLYIFSGLGTDHRVFQRINFGEWNLVFIQWITPKKQETIEEYALRVSEQILEENPTIIGLSFGGMMAIEVSKLLNPKQLILIATAKTQQEIPWYYRFAGKIKLHKLLPTRLLTRSNALSNWFFGTTSAFDRDLLKEILRETDPVFLKWAMDQIVKWQNETVIENTIHIHGTADRILPKRFVNAHYSIQNGGHFMTVNKADEISQLMLEIIEH